MKHQIAFASLLAVVLTAHGEPLPPTAKSEVAAVLARLEASGCQFNRNGTWHSGAEARSHLQSKLEYLESKGAPKSAEEFIDLAATKSSFTGTPYQVKCGAEASIPSAVWLKLQLQEVRHTTTKPVGK
jgi:hypothetical protein